ncbi:protein of unknown function [Candidatus Bipolaricaulis anaerobius]|uniref:Uncharacterized protein n=1 Tax=Candidatus Bipolaricaulis anaerobius TaxID=2026885 RepID=A0A2X3L2C0_9BACT|nr:protein of unknown function [Candidatus Bipolaricaulis anaerobius]
MSDARDTWQNAPSPILSPRGEEGLRVRGRLRGEQLPILLGSVSAILTPLRAARWQGEKGEDGGTILAYGRGSSDQASRDSPGDLP